MEKQLNITQVRDELGNLVDDVQYGNSKYIILRHGKPAAVVVPLHIYESWKSSRERLFDRIAQMQAAAGETDPDEVMALAQEAQVVTRAQTAAD